MSQGNIWKLKRNYDAQKENRPNQTQYNSFSLNKASSQQQSQMKAIKANPSLIKIPEKNDSMSLIEQKSPLKQKSINILKSQSKIRQKQFQVQRYLKEYQYNCRQSSDVKENNISQNIEKQKNICVQNQNKNYKNPTKEHCSRQRQQRSKFQSLQRQIILQGNDLCDFPLNNQKRKLSFTEKSYQKPGTKATLQFSKAPLLQQKDHSSNSYIFLEDIHYQTNHQRYALQFEKLKSQNQFLKQKLTQKQVYIKKLQQKFEKHLMEKLEVQRFIEENTKKLQINLQISNQKTKQVQDSLIKCKKNMEDFTIFYLEIVKIIGVQVFDQSDSQISLASEGIQKVLHHLRGLVYKNQTYELFFSKIYEMRHKIQQKQRILNKNQQLNQEIQYSKIQYEKSQDLRDLWKWLKRIGKQYQLMQQKVEYLRDLNVLEKS